MDDDDDDGLLLDRDDATTLGDVLGDAEGDRLDGSGDEDIAGPFTDNADDDGPS